jgi:transposase-like protein
MTGRTGARRRRWSADEAREVIAEWRRSGQSASAFSRARGYSAMRLSYWAKRVSSDAAVRFVPVAVAGSDAGLPAVIEIEYEGVTLRVREAFGAEQIAQLCGALVRAMRPC